MNMLAQQEQMHDSLTFQPRTVWERRFLKEGRIWGDNPSPAAKFLIKHLGQKSSRIFEIGAGYGRDTSAFIANGHYVRAVDQAQNALLTASEEMREHIERNAIFLTGDFRRASTIPESQDVVFSHRTIHLLGKNGVAHAFANVAAEALRTDGDLLITARTHTDFDPQDMVWVDEKAGVAKYNTELEHLKDRVGQTLYFWSESDLRDLFGEDFEIKSIVEGEEPESVGNLNLNGTAKMTQYLSLLAKRKSRKDLHL